MVGSTPASPQSLGTLSSSSDGLSSTDRGNVIWGGGRKRRKKIRKKDRRQGREKSVRERKIERERESGRQGELK